MESQKSRWRTIVSTEPTVGFVVLVVGWLACFSSGVGRFRVRVRVESMLIAGEGPLQEESLRDFTTVSGKLLLTEGGCMKSLKLDGWPLHASPSSPIHAVGHWGGSHFTERSQSVCDTSFSCTLGTQNRAEQSPQACRRLQGRLKVEPLLGFSSESAFICLIPNSPLWPELSLWTLIYN